MNAERLLDELGAGLRKCAASIPVKSTRCATYSPVELKAEAIRLQPLTSMSKRACARAFGVPWETARDWLDPGQGKKRPREDFVEWLACHANAAALVRRAS